MPKIERASLMSLETYARERPIFRSRVIAHKRNRTVHLGEHITLIFEDELTMRYQIQEMLRAERIFEDQGINNELDAYNPLIPDGRNFKATLMIEYPDPQERKKWLAMLIGVAEKVWMRVEGCEQVWAVADEDLDRENTEKTASVHFLRFELTDDMARKMREPVQLNIGVDHPAYQVSVYATQTTRSLLAQDLA
ncbi:MAG: DUF3501 family protein [Betaproteobacteria bacterium]|nr:DUF3501 family protein [Betaproteobacteria bacterium]